MGLIRFRRSFKLPGIRINLSKTGASTSIGRRGAWFTIGPGGTRATIGLPGSGLSYSETERLTNGGSAPLPPDSTAPVESENSGNGGRVFFVLAIIIFASVWLFVFL